MLICLHTALDFHVIGSNPTHIVLSSVPSIYRNLTNKKVLKKKLGSSGNASHMFKHQFYSCLGYSSGFLQKFDFASLPKLYLTKGPGTYPTKFYYKRLY